MMNSLVHILENKFKKKWFGRMVSSTHIRVNNYKLKQNKWIDLKKNY